VTGLWASAGATTPVAPIGRSGGRERYRSIRPWAHLGVGIEVCELSRPNSALLDARIQVRSTNPERVPGGEERALVNHAVQRCERNSEVTSGLSGIEPLALVIEVVAHRRSASAGHILHTPHKLAGVDVECGGQSGDGVEARIALATLQRTDIRPGDAGPVGEPFLRQALPLALLPDAIAEQPLAGSRSFPGSGHVAIRERRSIGVDAIGVTLSFSQRKG